MPDPEWPARTGYHDSAWGPDIREEAASLSHVRLQVTRAVVDYTATPFAAVSLHALARWYERRRAPDLAALYADIAAIAAVPPPEFFSRTIDAVVQCPGGVWRGFFTMARESRRLSPTFAARTFVAVD